MPLALPKQRGVRREASVTGRLSSTYGTTLTSDGTAHVEPATKTQMIASTSFDTYWINVYFHTNSGANTATDSLVRIYVGAAGSEQLLIPDLLAGWIGGIANATGGMPRVCGFPLFIPAGSRLSATHRSVRLSTAVTCWLELFGGDPIPHWVGKGVEAVGAVTASSRGTLVTAGTAGEGTLTSIGTTVHDWGYVFPVCAGNADSTASGQAIFRFDLAGGSSTSDLLGGLDEFESSITAAEASQVRDRGRFAYVPAGETIYARVQASAASDQQGVIVYGAY